MVFRYNQMAKKKNVESSKPCYIFVGAFREGNADGSTGGQLYACRTLLNSPISEHIDWILIDSTQKSVPAPPLHKRLVPAIKRLLRFVCSIKKSSVTGALIFTSDGPGFIEKGVMAIIAYTLDKRIILCPRSGLITDDFQKSAFMRKFIPFVIRHCDIIICQSREWKDFYELISNLPDKCFIVIPNWIDIAPYTEIFELKNYEAQKLTILFLGWIERFKGIYDLIEASYRYRDDLRDVRVMICGKGSELSRAQQRVSELGISDIIEFHGWVKGNEKLSALRQAEIFVLPSHREGLPNALLEAMASGLAVISTRSGGIPSVLKNDSLGILVEPGDIEELGRAILELVHHPEKRVCLGKNARDHIAKNYDIQQAWYKMLQILSV